uniref:Spindle assembly checkpoint component MAD1 n=1 Tax=Paramoeba aestuarina TaxID=180227 RepID=A0A7S4USN7_9EUKA
MDDDFTQAKAKEQKDKMKLKRLFAAKKELTAKIKLLEEQNERLVDAEEELSEELMVANAKIRDLTAKAQDVHDNGVPMDALISDVAELGRKRQEVDNLRVEVEVLREWKREHLEIEEKYLAAKNTITRFEIRVEEMAARQEECEDAKEKWDELEIALNKSENITVPDVVARCSEMKQKIVSLEQVNRRLEEENNRMKKSLELSSDQSKLIEENISLQNKTERLQAEVELLYASRKETREMFGSISTEKGLPESVAECVLASFDSIAQKIDALFQEKMDVLLKEKLVVENELTSCQKTMKEMAQRIETLEGRVNMGEFNPAKTKALHLRINPSNTANTRELLMKLRESEEGLLPGTDSAPAPSSRGGALSSSSLGENPQVKAILRRMKTKHDSELDLMKRKFRQKISEFRMAVYWVFGWRFDAESETGPKKRRYRLRSMFSTDGDVLVLEVGESGSLELLDSDFGKKMLEGLPGRVLQESGSIPAFLGQIILDLK